MVLQLWWDGSGPHKCGQYYRCSEPVQKLHRYFLYALLLPIFITSTYLFFVTSTIVERSHPQPYKRKKKQKRCLDFATLRSTWQEWVKTLLNKEMSAGKWTVKKEQWTHNWLQYNGTLAFSRLVRPHLCGLLPRHHAATLSLFFIIRIIKTINFFRVPF